MKKKHLRSMVLSAFFLALGLIFPFLTAQIPQFGNALCPMHFPVMLCGFICGGSWGCLVGAITPIARSLIFSMPAIATALPMAFELAAYGFFAGTLFRLFRQKAWSVYPTMVLSMLLGRIIWGIASWIFYGMSGQQFTMQIFWVSGFITAIPGMIAQLVLIPIILIILQKAKLFPLHDE